MANATREAILSALLALIAGSGSFVTTGRRNRAPETLGPALCPAVVLVKAGEDYERRAPNLPPIITLAATAFFYNDVGKDPNAIPETLINNALDALDRLMLPDNPRTGYFTLGGIVTSCMVSGRSRASAGEVTGKSMAVVPLEIILPLSANG
jgi:hypothetical protein